MADTRLKITYTDSQHQMPESPYDINADSTKATFDEVLSEASGDMVHGIPRKRFEKIAQQIAQLNREAEMSMRDEEEDEQP